MPELITISGNYKRLTPAQADVFNEVLADAWQNPEIPQRQYDSVVRGELESYGRGEPNISFDALKRVLSWIPQLNDGSTQLLDVGASSAYYSEVLKIMQFRCQYTALDFSPYFKDLASRIFPEVSFYLGSADALPFENKSFHIVLHGGCIMTMRSPARAIAEAARVTRQYVIFHRTPVFTDKTKTEYWVKTAYGVPGLEVHYNEMELMQMWRDNGLVLRGATPVFMDGNFGHVSYLLEIE